MTFVQFFLWQLDQTTTIILLLFVRQTQAHKRLRNYNQSFIVILLALSVKVGNPLH